MGVQCLIAWVFIFVMFVNSSFALLRTTNDDKFLYAFRVVQQNYKKQRKISQNFQNKNVFFSLTLFK